MRYRNIFNGTTRHKLVPIQEKNMGSIVKKCGASEFLFFGFFSVIVYVIDFFFMAQISTNVAQYDTIKKKSKFEKCGASKNFVFFLFSRICFELQSCGLRHNTAQM